MFNVLQENFGNDARGGGAPIARPSVWVIVLPLRFFYLLYFTTGLLQTISTLSFIFYPIVHDLCSNIPVNILTLDVLVPVYSAYKNLVISSIGLSRFNRLGSSFSSRTV